MISPGQTLPDVAIMKATEDGPEAVDLGAYFAGKTTALFAVPGAFTPTCSARHLPGFVDQAEALKAKGIDQIACVSVNDAFVMQAWGESANATDTVDMLADGNAEFTKALGLTMDASGFGMGERSQRYAMVVKDGTVEHLFVEEGGAFEVSSADYMVEKL